MTQDCNLKLDRNGYVVTQNGTKICRTDGKNLYFFVKDRRKQQQTGSCEVRVSLRQLRKFVDTK